MRLKQEGYYEFHISPCYKVRNCLKKEKEGGYSYSKALGSAPLCDLFASYSWGYLVCCCFKLCSLIYPSGLVLRLQEAFNKCLINDKQIANP